jgi:transketolase C-terminal domain/subunit
MGLLSSTQVMIAIGAGVVLAGYVILILAPAWVSYGRVWERVAASFLTLVMLVTLVAVGVVLGIAIIWFGGNVVGA